MGTPDQLAKLIDDAMALTNRPERATDRTHRAVEFAISAAHGFGAPVVDSRHLLCGLMREGQGVAYYILNHFGLKQDRLEMMVAGTSSDCDGSLLLLGDDLATVLSESWKTATSLNHNYIGTEHILLAMLSVQSQAGDVLGHCGINGNAVSSDVRRLLGVAG